MLCSLALSQARNQCDSWPWDDCPNLSGRESERQKEDVEFGSITTREKAPKPKKIRFSRLTLSGEYMGLCRRRVGRGGR